jgi:hypothetical protein
VVRRRPSTAFLALFAFALAAAAAVPALLVRDCPQAGKCHWSPALGIPAALVACLAAGTGIAIRRRARHGQDSGLLGWWVLLAVVLLACWWIAFFATLAAD